jgi:hypothetical protein
MRALRSPKRRVDQPLAEFLEENSIPVPESGCHLWLRAASEGGYGRFTVGGRRLIAHRVAWELRNGPIPPGMVACHKCDTRICINPDHIFIGTPGDNVRDCVRKLRNRKLHLTPEEVRAIRAMTLRAAHVAFGISTGWAYRIKHRTAHGEVP